MKFVHVLVDYDNVIHRAEKTQDDVALNLHAMCGSISHKVSAIIPNSEELLIRFYGGWITLGNQYSFRANWLLAELPNFRKKFGPVRLKPTIITGLHVRPDLTLIGTYQGDEQKMVDEMITVDAVELARDDETSLVLVSDDEDFVPAAVAAGELKSKKNPVYLLRRIRSFGDGVNDAALKECNVVIEIY